VGVAGTAARTRRWACSGPLILAFAVFAAPAQAAPAVVNVGDFDGPTYATGAPGDASRVFVTEKPGRVRVIRDGAVLARPFLDVTATTSSSDEERGLLSMAFAPDYASSGRFYVYLTAQIRRALRRHRSLRVTVTLRATDAAGNVARGSRTMRVRG
jgi:glucose/arabinose dehydrogenase